MGNDSSSVSSTRRKFLGTLATAGTAAVAGCQDGGDSDDGTTSDDQSDTSDGQGSPSLDDQKPALDELLEKNPESENPASVTIWDEDLENEQEIILGQETDEEYRIKPGPFETLEDDFKHNTDNLDELGEDVNIQFAVTKGEDSENLLEQTVEPHTYNLKIAVSNGKDETQTWSYDLEVGLETPGKVGQQEYLDLLNQLNNGERFVDLMEEVGEDDITAALTASGNGSAEYTEEGKELAQYIDQLGKRGDAEELARQVAKYGENDIQVAKDDLVLLKSLTESNDFGFENTSDDWMQISDTYNEFINSEEVTDLIDSGNLELKTSFDNIRGLTQLEEELFNYNGVLEGLPEWDQQYFFDNENPAVERLKLLDDYMQIRENILENGLTPEGQEYIQTASNYISARIIPENPRWQQAEQKNVWVEYTETNEITSQDVEELKNNTLNTVTANDGTPNAIKKNFWNIKPETDLARVYTTASTDSHKDKAKAGLERTREDLQAGDIAFVALEGNWETEPIDHTRELTPVPKEIRNSGIHYLHFDYEVEDMGPGRSWYPHGSLNRAIVNTLAVEDRVVRDAAHEIGHMLENNDVPWVDTGREGENLSDKGKRSLMSYYKPDEGWSEKEFVTEDFVDMRDDELGYSGIDYVPELEWMSRGEDAYDLWDVVEASDEIDIAS